MLDPTADPPPQESINQSAPSSRPEPAIIIKAFEQNESDNRKLARCPDCGNAVSKKANSCPNCGSPFRKTGIDAEIASAKGCVIFIIILLFLMMLFNEYF